MKYPDDLRTIASSVALGGLPHFSAEIRECVDSWEADAAVVDAVLNAPAIRTARAGVLRRRSYVWCVFCDARGHEVQTLIHEPYCVRVLAQLRADEFVQTA